MEKEREVNQIRESQIGQRGKQVTNFKNLETTQKSDSMIKEELTVQDHAHITSIHSLEAVYNETRQQLKDQGIAYTTFLHTLQAVKTVDEIKQKIDDIDSKVGVNEPYNPQQMGQIKALHVRGMELFTSTVFFSSASDKGDNEIKALDLYELDEFCHMAWHDIQNVPPYCGLSIKHIVQILGCIRSLLKEPEIQFRRSREFYNSHIQTYSSIGWEMYMTNWSANGRRLFDCNL